LVEDEALVAVTMEDLLQDLGCEIAGSVGSVAEALQWVEREGAADAALLDVSLDGEMVFPVADALAARDVPVIFITGCAEVPDPRYAAAPVLPKPIRLPNLEKALRAVGIEV
jgi:CheY-like chemotaxis protein